MCVCGVNAQSDSSFQRGFNSLLHYMVHRMPGLCTIFTDPFIAFGMMRTIGRKNEEATLLTSHLLAILLTPFRDGFTRPTWRKVLILLEGTLLARGRRTVTAALRMMDLHQLTRFNVFHHVLSRARWSPLQMSRVLFLLLVHAFVPAGSPVHLVVDETLERRWGPHIRKCSVYHDLVRSTERVPKMSRGLRWLCLMLVVKPAGPNAPGRCRFCVSCSPRPSMIGSWDGGIRPSPIGPGNSFTSCAVGCRMFP